MNLVQKEDIEHFSHIIAPVEKELVKVFKRPKALQEKINDVFYLSSKTQIQHFIYFINNQPIDRLSF